MQIWNQHPKNYKNHLDLWIMFFACVIIVELVTTVQSTGMGGEVQKGMSKIEILSPVTDRVIRVRFNADTASSMQWNFRPHLSEIKVNFVGKLQFDFGFS